MSFVNNMSIYSFNIDSVSFSDYNVSNNSYYSLKEE